MKPAGQAVEELIQKYGKLVFQTIYAMTGDWEESQDLTQDTFHQAFKAIDAARAASGSRFREKAWLLRIALNTVRMQRRRRRLFRFIPFSYLQRGNQSTEKAYNTGTDTLEEQAAPVQPVGYGVTWSEDPFRSSAISQRAKLRACLICRKQQCANASRERANNFSGCMPWKSESKLAIVTPLPRAQASNRGR